MHYVHIIGATSQITVCLGATVTYRCTVDSMTHIWRVGSREELTIDADTGEDTYVVQTGFTFRLETVGSTHVESSVSGKATVELSNTVISCRDGLSQPGQGEQQEFIINFHGE